MIKNKCKKLISSKKNRYYNKVCELFFNYFPKKSKNESKEKERLKKRQAA